MWCPTQDRMWEAVQLRIAGRSLKLIGVDRNTVNVHRAVRGNILEAVILLNVGNNTVRGSKYRTLIMMGSVQLICV